MSSGPQHFQAAEDLIQRGLAEGSFELFVAAQAHATLALAVVLLETPGTLGGNPSLGEWVPVLERTDVRP